MKFPKGKWFDAARERYELVERELAGTCKEVHQPEHRILYPEKIGPNLGTHVPKGGTR